MRNKEFQQRHGGQDDPVLRRDMRPVNRPLNLARYIALRVRRYHFQHGQWPARLEDIGPDSAFDHSPADLDLHERFEFKVEDDGEQIVVTDKLTGRRYEFPTRTAGR